MAAMGASAHSLQGATMQYRSAGRPMRALRGHAPAPMAVMACAAPAAAACAAPAGAGIGFKTGGWAWGACDAVGCLSGKSGAGFVLRQACEGISQCP